MTHPPARLGGGGGGRFASSEIWSWSLRIWPFRLSIASFMLLMVSCRVWFWAIIACLSDRSSSILAVIMSFICSLWAAMSALNCSSKRFLSSSCFSCSSFIWRVMDFRFASYILLLLLKNKFSKSRQLSVIRTMTQTSRSLVFRSSSKRLFSSLNMRMER